MELHLRNVGDRIAISLPRLSAELGCPIDTILDILAHQKIIAIENVDIAQTARELIGKAEWHARATMADAPYIFSCSSMSKYLVGLRGIWVPRRTRQQLLFCRTYGVFHTDPKRAEVGDFLFVDSQTISKMHVSVVVESGRAVSAVSSELGRGIVEHSFDEIFKTRALIGFGKVRESLQEWQTMHFPSHRGIELVDDLACIVRHVRKLDAVQRKMI